MARKPCVIPVKLFNFTTVSIPTKLLPQFLVMKKGLKITFIVLGALLGAIILALILIPVLFKPQLLRLAETQINKQINAHVAFSDLDISIFRNFPQLSISLEKLSVVNRAPFEGDTLVAFDRFAVCVNLLSLFDLSNLEVHEIVLERPRIYGQQDSLGRANWDITYHDSVAKPQTPAEASEAPSQLKLKLRRFAIRDAQVGYRDDVAKLDARLRHLNFELTGDFGLKETELSLHLDIDSVRLVSGGIPYVSQVRFAFDATVDADLENKVFKLSDNELALNDFILALAGQVALRGEAIDTDLTLQTNKASIPGLLSLVPVLYTQDLKGLKTTGTLQLSGFVKGTKEGKQLPDAELRLAVNDATFQYPLLPKAVTGFNLDFLAQVNGRDQDASVLRLRNLSLAFGGNPVRLQAQVTTPLSDPNLWAKAVGHVDLASMSESIPLGDKKLSGKAELDMDLAAPLSAIKTQHFEKCVLNGFLGLKDILLTQALGEHDANLRNLALRFSQQAVDLEKFDATIASSDLQLSGGISNFLPFYFAHEVISGKLDLTSQRLDLRELMPTVAAPAPEEKTEGSEPVTLTPEQLDLFRRIAFALRVNIKELFFQEYRMTEAGGRVDIADGQVRIANLGCGLFDGDARISGIVDLSTAPFRSSWDVSVSDLNVADAVRSVKTVRDLVPGVVYANGHAGVNFTGGCVLGEGFAPDLQTVNVKGRIAVGELSIKDAPLFREFSKLLVLPELENPTFAGGTVGFTVENGTVTFEPYQMKVKNIEGNVGGTVKLDQTMDLKLSAQVPSAALGKAGSGLSSLLTSYNTGLTLPEYLPVWVRASGNISAPKIDFGMDNVTPANVKEVVKDQVTTVIRNTGVADSILARAQREGERILEAAKKLADKTRDESKARAKQVVAEGEKNGLLAALAAKKAAEVVEKEGEEAARKIESEAQAKIDAILAKAKREAEKAKGN